MPPLMKFSNPIRLQKLTKVMQIRGVDTYFHWSVFVAIALILAGVASRPWLSLIGLLCYLGIFLIHETGHAIVAQRRGSRVLSIQIYPIFAITQFQAPWSRLDHCLIAWGGAVAQAIVFVPLLMWVAISGYSRFDVLNMIIAILGFYSLAVAVFNLLPVRGLDGSIAWSLFPELWRERRRRITRKPTYR
jgi:Zn-dependent protease